MQNPFKQNGYMLPIASINNSYVGDRKVSKLFRPSLIKDTILEHRDILGLDHLEQTQDLLEVFNDLIVSDVPSIRLKALEIATFYGKQLAKILANFFHPSDKTIKNQSKWTQQHWDYWQNIEQIYLVGGISSPILTKIFFQEIKTLFEVLNLKKEVKFITGSQDLGTIGLTTLINSGEYLLFDFGQTKIKRAHHIKENGETKVDIKLSKVNSKYLFYKNKQRKELRQVANKLHQYIVRVVVETDHEVAFDGNNIYIAIANYVNQGNIYPHRGGYGKLAQLSDNYEMYLSQSISNKLNRDIDVKLFHDTSAMALNFKNEKNTAVLSIGTAFGVAFPD